MPFILHLILFGACQGFGLSIVLWVKYKSVGTKDYNFLFVLTCVSLFLLIHYIYFSSIIDSYSLVIMSITVLLLLILLFISRFFRNNGIRVFHFWDKLLLSYLLIYISCWSVVFLNDTSPISNFQFIFNETSQALILVMYIVFIIKTFKKIFFSNKPSHVRFVAFFIILYTICWLLVLALQFSDLNIFNDYLYSIYFQLIPFFGVYLIGYYLIFNKANLQIIEQNPIVFNTTLQASRLKESIVENQLFLNPDLTLTMLSDSCKITPRQATSILKGEFNLGFYDFVNRFRLDYFIEQVERNPNLKYEAIALSSGFRNKTTFYKAFKKRFGSTPKVYFQENS